MIQVYLNGMMEENFLVYENDIRNGFGIYFQKDPLKIYVGFWENGKQNIFSKLKNSYKEVYCFWKICFLNKFENNNLIK